jgi:hypothetical protein
VSQSTSPSSNTEKMRPKPVEFHEEPVAGATMGGHIAFVRYVDGSGFARTRLAEDGRATARTSVRQVPFCG